MSDESKVPTVKEQVVDPENYSSFADEVPKDGLQRVPVSVPAKIGADEDRGQPAKLVVGRDGRPMSFHGSQTQVVTGADQLHLKARMREPCVTCAEFRFPRMDDKEYHERRAAMQHARCNPIMPAGFQQGSGDIRGADEEYGYCDEYWRWCNWDEEKMGPRKAMRWLVHFTQHCPSYRRRRESFKVFMRNIVRRVRGRK